MLRFSSQERSRTLNFLLRWNHILQLHACLDVLLPANPNLVSLLDLRARAFLAEGKHLEALEVMWERLDISSSMTARVLLTRIHLERGDLDVAYQSARSLTEENQESVIVWGLLGQVELARKHLDAALEAHRRQRTLSPQSRAYLLGMLNVYRAQEDWVTASGYAVRLLRTATEDLPLPISFLQQLRAYFVASEETTRADDIRTELARRYADELARLQKTLSVEPRAYPQPHSDQVEVRAPSAVTPVSTLDQIPVSAEEQTRITQAVQQYFGFNDLLPGQAESLACALRGENVLTILPTGGGKSLCYQLPALLDECGATLVISPLIALMKDQVDSLPNALQSRATTINSSLEGDELGRRLSGLAQGAYRLVYVAPERLRQPSFLHTVRKADLRRLVVDEAHCVSVWGHDFRPDYLTIGQVRQALGNPPLLALTATAPPRVRRDIANHLGTLRVVASDVTRPNLTLQVLRARNADDKLYYLLAFCKATSGAGIVYVDTRARSEELAALLRRYGISAKHYHAGIADRARVQDDFMTGRIRIVVATIAFGMGIDKPDIRFIVHFGLARSLEAYYQEAGRAGRDGSPSHCLLIYAAADRGVLTRRSRRDLLTADFLRSTYAAVKRRLNGQASGRVIRADLERDLQTDDTRIRVALSLLQEAGLVRLGPDVPRTATVCLQQSAASSRAASSAAFTAFCQAARLRPDQRLDIDVVAVARESGLPLTEIERHALEWADAGWISYYASGQDMLIELPVPPEDAPERVAALIERQATIQVQRVDEMVSYAETRRCRHGHINAYLGGRPIERCPSCDNCVRIPALPDPGLPGEREQLQTILRSVSDAHRWGRNSLVRILTGDPGGGRRDYTLSPAARENAQFGALAFRSKPAVGRLLDRLLRAGFLEQKQLAHGGILLDLTDEGRDAIKKRRLLDDLVHPPPEPRSSRPPPGRRRSRPLKLEAPAEIDEELLTKLRSWRGEQARSEKVPPYFVFHTKHLRAIAGHRPTSLDDLSKVKGVGPARLEKYGQAVIQIVEAHLRDRDDTAL
jgi:ATP-dependent DNA helicase RecQ